jgi:hypothetical protein
VISRNSRNILVFRKRSLIGVASHNSKKGWLAVTPDGRPFGCRAEVRLHFEQRGLARLRGVPCLKLLPAQFAEPLPAKGVTIDNEGVGLCHDTPAQAAWAGRGHL